jgi:hypothetical protein
MHLFISTSRKPSASTRQLAKWLELLLGAKYENRGKQSVEEVWNRAKALGCRRVLFIYERKGNPSEMIFFHDGVWLKPELEINGVVFPPEGTPHVRPGGVRFVSLNAEGERIQKLFDIKMPQHWRVDFCAGTKEMFFRQDGNKVGPLIKYGVRK